MREESSLIKHISVVGNKIDLRDRFNPKHVTRKEGQELSLRKNVEFFETSAKLGHNIIELFSQTFDGMIKRYILTPIDLSVLKYKAILLGDPNVGKSSLIDRFCGNPFNEMPDNTNGTHFKTFSRKLNQCSIQLEFWDTKGQVGKQIATNLDNEIRENFENFLVLI